MESNLPIFSAQVPALTENDEQHVMQTSMQQHPVGQPVTFAPPVPQYCAVNLTAPTGGNEHIRFRFNPDVPAFDPNQPPIHTMSEFLQDLYAQWTAVAFSWQGGTRAAAILTWYVSPGRGLARCLESRRVTLFDNAFTWESKITHAWGELVDPNEAIHFFVILPPSPHLETSIAAHVLIAQQTRAEESSSLVTIYDPAVHQGRPFRVVVTTPARAFPAQIE